MKTIATKDLELDLLKGHYLEETCKVYLKTGELIEGMLTEYTHDEEPFINYIVVNKKEYSFADVDKIEFKDIE